MLAMGKWIQNTTRTIKSPHTKIDTIHKHNHEAIKKTSSHYTLNQKMGQNNNPINWKMYAPNVAKKTSTSKN
jgi:hypothetical protein